MKRVSGSVLVILLLSGCAPGRLGSELRGGLATRLEALGRSIPSNFGRLQLPRPGDLLSRAPSPDPLGTVRDELSRIRHLSAAAGQLHIPIPSNPFRAVTEARRLRVLADSFLTFWAGEQEIRLHGPETILRP